MLTAYRAIPRLQAITGATTTAGCPGATYTMGEDQASEMTAAQQADDLRLTDLGVFGPGYRASCVVLSQKLDLEACRFGDARSSGARRADRPRR